MPSDGGDYTKAPDIPIDAVVETDPARKPDMNEEVRDMKLIIAYINPFKLDEIRDALKEAGVSGLSASSIQGFGRQAGHTEAYRGAEYEVDFVPKVRIEVLVDDTLAPTVISTIEETARTGSIGDGKIAVLPIEDVIRIRTGERGGDAI